MQRPGRGVWAAVAGSARLVKSPDDFFMGGRRFKKAFMLFFAFGAGTHSDQAVSVASKTYTSGLSGIWLQWIWLFATPFYWLIAPVFRRMRALNHGRLLRAALFAFGSRAVRRCRRPAAGRQPWQPC